MFKMIITEFLNPKIIRGTLEYFMFLVKLQEFLKFDI